MDRLFRFAASAGATAAVAGAASPIRAANTLFPAFLGLVDIRPRAANNGQQNQDNQDISHRNASLAASSGAGLQLVLGLHVLIGVHDDAGEDRDNRRYHNQAGNEARAHIAGGDQRTNLVNQEAHCVADA